MHSCKYTLKQVRYFKNNLTLLLQFSNICEIYSLGNCRLTVFGSFSSGPGSFRKWRRTATPTVFMRACRTCSGVGSHIKSCRWTVIFHNACDISKVSLASLILLTRSSPCKNSEFNLSSSRRPRSPLHRAVFNHTFFPTDICRWDFPKRGTAPTLCSMVLIFHLFNYLFFSHKHFL